MIVVGVDPGKLGYSCLLVSDASGVFGRIFWATPLAGDDYDRPALAQLCHDWILKSVDLVVIEKQAPRAHGSPLQAKFGAGREGTKSSWTNGYGYGLWLGCLEAAGFRVGGLVHRYVEVEPVVWKRAFGALVTEAGWGSMPWQRKKAADAKTREVAKVIDPDLDLVPSERGGRARVDCTDKAASRLIAEYGLRVIAGVVKK